MKYKLSKEEKELMASVENDEWVEIENFPEEKLNYEQYAATTLDKYKEINITIPERDLREIQRISIEEGLTYQTLIASIVHKYLTGKLVTQ